LFIDDHLVVRLVPRALIDLEWPWLVGDFSRAKLNRHRYRFDAWATSSDWWPAVLHWAMESVLRPWDKQALHLYRKRAWSGCAGRWG